MDDYSALLEAAKTARSMAYAPYSHYKVGAAILAENGIFYQGANVENVSYPLGSCAEATAISTMVMAGQQHIMAIAVIGSHTEICTPCGGCRQRLREFCHSSDIPIICASECGTKILQTSLCALLPHSFGPKHLDGVVTLNNSSILE